MKQLFRELKRRNVYQVAATYGVVGFVLIQVADLTFVRLGLPSWTVTFLIVLVAMGFPLAVVLAWAFELTTEGVRRTADATSAKGTTRSGQRAVRALVGLGLVAGRGEQVARDGWRRTAGRWRAFGRGPSLQGWRGRRAQAIRRGDGRSACQPTGERLRSRG